MLPAISTDMFEVVGVRPVRCIGVAALSPSAWEACGGAGVAPSGYEGLWYFG
jgi:hypothetical protein